MDDAPILDEPWPRDLNPAHVPFRTRTVTVLTRMGYPDDPSLFNTLTESVVLSWTNAGPKTVADIRNTGNEAIRQHHERAVQFPVSGLTWLARRQSRGRAMPGIETCGPPTTSRKAARRTDPLTVGERRPVCVA